MIRKGRKPKPQNEEEMLQQIEEIAASKLRKAEKKNASKRAKRIVKLNMGPLLGAAKEPSEKTKNKIQKKHVKSQDQQTSHQTPKSSVKSSTPEDQEESHERFLEDIDKASLEHSSASNNINPLESKGNAIQQLREKLKEELIASELEAMGDTSIFKNKEKKKRKSEEKDLDLLWTEKEALAFKAFELHHGCKAFSCKSCGNEESQIVNCIDCNQVICGKCDEEIHLQNPFHQRSLYSKTRPGKQLLPEFQLNFLIVRDRLLLNALCSPCVPQNVTTVKHLCHKMPEA